MRYRSSYKGLQQRGTRPKRKISGNFQLWFLVGGFVLLFIVSVFVFRNTKPEKQVGAADAILNTGSSAMVNPATLTNFDATLFGVSSGKAVGTATRALANGVFHVNIRAAMPDIDRESQFYQVWLVRPVPYDFISAGEMVTNELGTFVLDWNGLSDKDYSGYIDLVITLQTRNGDADPQMHIVEGEFGK